MGGWAHRWEEENKPSTALPAPIPAATGFPRTDPFRASLHSGVAPFPSSYLLSACPSRQQGQGPPLSAAAAPREPGTRREEASPAAHLRKSPAGRGSARAVLSRPRRGGKFCRAAGEERRLRRCESADSSTQSATRRGSFAGCPARSGADVTSGAWGTRFSQPPLPDLPPPPRIPPAALAGSSASGSVARRGSSPAI